MFIALTAGAVLYFLQVNSFYNEVATNDATIKLTSIVSGKPEEIIADDFEGLDNPSSPIQFRGCFTTPMSQSMLTETYVPYDKAVPQVGPGWLTCYNVKTIRADMQAGKALAFLGQENIADGIDRVVIIYSDGRAYVGHQRNKRSAD